VPAHGLLVGRVGIHDDVHGDALLALLIARWSLHPASLFAYEARQPRRRSSFEQVTLDPQPRVLGSSRRSRARTSCASHHFQCSPGRQFSTPWRMRNDRQFMLRPRSA
jgi:hypothetical protein